MPTEAPGPAHARAQNTADVAGRPRFSPHVAFEPTELTTIAYQMFILMMRNVATDSFVFVDPNDSTIVSKPGCILAAPSYPAFLSGVDQDYVYNWTRDGAITAMEIAAARIPPLGAPGVQPLINYVLFAKTCQDNAAAAGIFARASFTIDGQPRRLWTDQNDGAALQTLAVLRAYDQIDAPTQAVARQVIARNLEFLLQVYKDQTFNLWEEHFAFSFFARSAQLKCFQAIQANSIGVAVPSGVVDAIAFLKSALAEHWNGDHYVSLLDASGQPPVPFYDPNIDIVSACLYGAVRCTDPKLLATAERLRSQWADDASPDQYPINRDDAARGLGPLLGRYPGDVYDGDSHDDQLGRHPWALCTCNLAELYYTLANEITATNSIPSDPIAAPFFRRFNATAATPIPTVAAALRSAADAMLRAVVYHSDHLELSEQFDGATGIEKSVKNLTWSYAAFLSAVRARSGKNG